MDEARRSPSTLGLSALWILVFLAMQLWQGSFSLATNPFTLGVLRTDTTHLFGDATTADLASGQLWRALTSTFIHFSLLHLVLNVLGLLPLGMIIESWYGWGPLLLIYVLIGFLGNLLAGELRPWFGIVSFIHCGGGSTVVFGLISLCTVVGWRARTKDGRDLGNLMFGILLLNYGLGFACWAASRWLHWQLPSFDHLAHISGTIVGALLGFLHQRFKKLKNTRRGALAGVVGLLSLLLAFGFQLRSSRADIAAAHTRTMVAEQWRQKQMLVDQLLRLDLLYHLAYQRGKGREFVVGAGPRRPGGLNAGNMVAIPEKDAIDAGLKSVIDSLRIEGSQLPAGDVAHAYERLLTLASKAIERAPSKLQVQEFEARYVSIFPKALQDLSAAQKQLIAVSSKERVQ